MTAAVQPLTVEAGGDWDLVLTFWQRNDDGSKGALINWTGYEMTLEVRPNSSTSDDPPVYMLSTVDQPAVLGPDGSNHDVPAEIVLGGSAGTVTIHVPAARTLWIPQVTYTVAIGGDPNQHYTLIPVSGGGAEDWLLTGLLTVLVK